MLRSLPVFRADPVLPMPDVPSIGLGGGGVRVYIETITVCPQLGLIHSEDAVWFPLLSIPLLYTDDRHFSSIGSAESPDFSRHTHTLSILIRLLSRRSDLKDIDSPIKSWFSQHSHL